MGFADCNGGKLKSIYIKVKVPLSPLRAKLMTFRVVN